MRQRVVYIIHVGLMVYFILSVVFLVLNVLGID
jgi:hypothetical protein